MSTHHRQNSDENLAEGFRTRSKFPSDNLIPTGTAKVRLDATHALLLLIDLLVLRTPILQEKSAPV